jgi:hypothetical protein
VLPEFEAATWPASNVRACLALLAYLEDRIAVEADVLLNDNKALKSLFESMVSDSQMPPLEGDLRAQLETLLQFASVRPDSLTVSQLERENESYQILLSKIIRRVFELRDASDPHSYARFRERVRACLSAVHTRDFGLAARAAALVPF